MHEHHGGGGGRPGLDLSRTPFAVPLDERVRLLEKLVPTALVEEMREEVRARHHHVVRVTAASSELETRLQQLATPSEVLETLHLTDVGVVDCGVLGRKTQLQSKIER